MPLFGVGGLPKEMGTLAARATLHLQQQVTQGKAESPMDKRETGISHQDKSKAAAEMESLLKMSRCISGGARSSLGGFGPRDSSSKCLYFLR